MEVNIIEIPVWNKYALTREEAALYFHLGENRLSEWIKENPQSDCLLWVGNRTLFKRQKFENYLNTLNTF